MSRNGATASRVVPWIGVAGILLVGWLPLVGVGVVSWRILPLFGSVLVWIYVMIGGLFATWALVNVALVSMRYDGYPEGMPLLRGQDLRHFWYFSAFWPEFVWRWWGMER